MTQPTFVNGNKRLLLAFLLICGAAIFLFRGPCRAIFQNGGPDLAPPFVGSWLVSHGENPYYLQNSAFNDLWHKLGAPASHNLLGYAARIAYPPPTLLLMAPMSLLSWKMAVYVYVAICSLLYILLLIRLSAFLTDKDRRIAFIAYGLAFSPVLTGIAVANLTTISFILVGLALLHVDKKPIAAGIMLGLGTCLKPTIGAPAILLIVLFKYWSAFSASFITAGSLSCASLLMLAKFPHWPSDYAAELADFFKTNGANNFTTPHDDRFWMVNLQVPIYGVTHSVMLSNCLAVGITAVLFGWWCRKYLSGSRLGLEAIAAFTLLILLPIYQRIYTGGFILFALIWAVDKRKESTFARSILLLGPLFLVPGQALLGHYSNRLPHILQEPFIKNIIYAYATWIILGMAIVVLAFKSRNESEAQAKVSTTGQSLTIGAEVPFPTGSV